MLALALSACINMVRLFISNLHLTCAAERSSSSRSASFTTSVSRAWIDRRRMKDSFALSLIARETISCSSDEVNVHWAASYGKPFQGMGVDSKDTAGGGTREGGARNVVIDGFGLSVSFGFSAGGGPAAGGELRSGEA
jgi:hypothetical protein